MTAIFIILASLAGISVAIMDRIQHYDNVGSGWWSRDAYHNAKYRFMAKYPRIPKWFVSSVIVIILDAWHTFKWVSLLCFFGMVALFNWPMALIGFGLYQLYFFIFYSE